jgi:Leucine-rich repeat (LRR) protein
MKVLTFDYCQYLTDIPDVSSLQNLEKFSFGCCCNLTTIDNSIGYLKKLEILIAYGCNKLEKFPPLHLTSLKKLELSYCKNLKSFPELLDKMTNIKDIWLCRTSIGEFLFSFQNLSELCQLTIGGCGTLKLSSNIFMMPKLSKITVKNCHLLLPKENDNLSSTVSLNVECLHLVKNRYSNEWL